MRLTIALSVNTACVLTIWYLLKYGLDGDYDYLTWFMIAGLSALIVFFAYDCLCVFVDTQTRKNVNPENELAEFTFFNGTQRQLLRLFEGNLLLPEKVLYPAIRLPDTMIYSVKPPGRHIHCRLRLMLDGKPINDTNYIYGYLTNHGRFLDRSRAMAIAEMASQVRLDKHKVTPINQLYCEDLILETQRE